MRKIVMGLLALTTLTVSTPPVMSAPGPSRIAFRGYDWYGAQLNNPGNYPSSHGRVDMGYHTNEANAMGAQFTLPEFYVFWNPGNIMQHPNGTVYGVHNHPLVQTIRNFGGGDGNRLYGLKIARENVGVNVNPPGPFAADTRILFSQDVDQIRNLLTQARNQGHIARDNFKLFQMVFEPDVFAVDPNAQNIIKKMDGVCFEVHHFPSLYWPLYGTRSDPNRVVAGCNWVLSNKNFAGQDLEYVFYYGPWRDPVTDTSINTDVFYTWLYEYWAKGLRKNDTRMIYDLNAFPHAGNNRPFGPESNSRSIAGILKWLVQQVKDGGGAPPPPPPGGGTVSLNKRAENFAIDGGNGGNNGQNVYLWSYSPSNGNQKWQEISRGGGYFTYKKQNTNFVLDGGNGGGNGQNVYLWSDGGNGNQNQHWKKVPMGGNYHRLEKRNAPAFSIDGGVGAGNGQNVYLWQSNNGNVNQHWQIQ